jgi:sugar phosphate isomerase/epimerase
MTEEILPGTLLTELFPDSKKRESVKMNDVPLTYLVDISGLSPAWRGVLLREYAVNGAENIVLSHNHFNMLLAAENPSELLEEYKKEVADAGLKFVDAHAVFGPDKDLNCPVAELRPAMLERQKKCLEWSAQCGVKTITIHTGNPSYPDVELETFHKYAIESLEILLPVAASYGITICIENIWFPTNTPAKLLDMLNHFNSPNLGFCFDSGHANIMAHPTENPESNAVIGWSKMNMPVQWSFEELEKMLPHIVNCHLHDNSGLHDRHQLPGHGDINWNDLLETLSGAPRLQCIQSEVLYPLYEQKTTIRGVCEKFSQMHRLFTELRTKKNI